MALSDRRSLSPVRDPLYNLVYDPAFLMAAWERVVTNKDARTARIDRATASMVETGIGVEAFLGQITPREEPLTPGDGAWPVRSSCRRSRWSGQRQRRAIRLERVPCSSAWLTSALRQALPGGAVR